MAGMSGPVSRPVSPLSYVDLLEQVADAARLVLHTEAHSNVGAWLGLIQALAALDGVAHELTL